MFDMVLNSPLYPLTILEKLFTYDVCQGPESSSAICTIITIRGFPIRSTGYYLLKFANIFHLNPSKIVHDQIQKQPPDVLCKKRCSQKFHRKTPVPESLFNKVRPQPATLLREKFWHRCFSVNFTKFRRKLFLQNTSG